MKNGIAFWRKISHSPIFKNITYCSADPIGKFNVRYQKWRGLEGLKSKTPHELICTHKSSFESLLLFWCLSWIMHNAWFITLLYLTFLTIQKLTVSGLVSSRYCFGNLYWVETRYLQDIFNCSSLNVHDIAIMFFMEYSPKCLLHNLLNKILWLMTSFMNTVTYICLNVLK